jgi:hypothetical protein
MTMFLVLSMVAPIIIEPLEVHADTDTTGDDVSYDGPTVSPGQPPNWDRSGWLFYVCDSNRQLLTPVLFILGTHKSPDTSYDRTYLTSRIGNQPAIATGLTAPWGAPVNGAGSNWEHVKADMDVNGLAYVAYYFGPDIATQVQNNADTIHVILETVCWHNKPGMPAGNNAVASCSGWARMAQDGGCVQTGFGWFPFNKIARSERLEYQWLGLDPPPTYIPNDNTTCISVDLLLAYSYGFVRLGLNPSDRQTTADEPLIPTPHDPPDESHGIKTIIKNYRTINDTTGANTDDGCTHRDNVSEHITIEEEGEYKVVGWKTSNTKNYSLDSLSWPVPGRVTQQGSTSGNVDLNSPIETVLYVVLERHISEVDTVGEGHFKLSESTITRKIKLSKPDNSAGYTNIKTLESHWTSQWRYHACHNSHSCSGCVHHTGQNSDGTSYDYYTCPGNHKCGGWKWKDNSLTFSLTNLNKTLYPDILATKGTIEEVTEAGSDSNDRRYVDYTRTKYEADDKMFKDWDYHCVIMRGKDKLTVAQWKNTDLGTSANTDLKDMSNSGFAIANTDSGTRKTSTYLDKFSIELAKLSDSNTDYRNGTGPTTAATGGGICPDDYVSDYVLKNNLKVNVDVRAETYSGSVSTTQNDSYYDGAPSSHGIFSGISLLSGLSKVQGVEVQSGPQLTFRPYVQMNYDLFDNKHEAYGSSSSAPHLTAYVLGELNRSMTPNDYAEVSWKERDIDKPNLTLNSLQWSTHSSAKDFITDKLGATNLNKFTVLPGGATLDLTIKDSDRQKVAVTTYQCTIEGTGKTQIDNAGGSYTGLTPDDAVSAHNAYVDSVMNGITNINVEQWVTNNIDSVDGGNITSSSKQVWNLGGEAIEWGYNLTVAGHPNQTASTEAKYYFFDEGERPDGPASEGDLDCRKISSESHKYTFYTNTFGEVYMLTDSVDGNKGDERAGTKITPGSLSGIAKQINDRTHVVDKLYKAVEHGTGNDPSGRSKTGTRWYNEAFDGITVYVQTDLLEVGYIDPPQRSTVLDVRLTQTQKNQDDMFNKDKYNMSQYRTREYSHAYPDGEGQVGEFKGAPVHMKEMEMLFFSRQFFIPNATVDDLH